MPAARRWAMGLPGRTRQQRRRRQVWLVCSVNLMCCDRTPQRERCRGGRCVGVRVRVTLRGELVVLRPGSAECTAAEPGFGLALFVCCT